LLAGVAGAPTRAIRLANVHETPATRYRPDPIGLVQAFRDLDDRGEDLVAIYHSHPASQAYPSPTDRAESADERGAPRFPGTVYVLVSLMGAEPETRAFRIDHDAVTELELA
jgi:proteasome lid subunit RPN8/RPN11